MNGRTTPTMDMAGMNVSPSLSTKQQKQISRREEKYWETTLLIVSEFW